MATGTTGTNLANRVAMRDLLRAETEGNPFFVTEILRHLAETGAISQRADGRWTAPARLQNRGLPISVREVVNSRAQRLGPETRKALDTRAGRWLVIAILSLVVVIEVIYSFAAPDADKNDVIAEAVVQRVKGKDVRHASAEQIRAEVAGE